MKKAIVEKGIYKLEEFDRTPMLGTYSRNWLKKFVKYKGFYELVKAKEEAKEEAKKKTKGNKEDKEKKVEEKEEVEGFRIRPVYFVRSSGRGSMPMRSNCQRMARYQR